MKILIVGLGGLGCAAATYLSRCSIPISILDDDLIEKSNLNRQILYNKEDIGKSKVEIVFNKLKDYSEITPYKIQISLNNVNSILLQHDIILDCTDNPITKYILALSSKQLSKILITASINKNTGYILTLDNRYCLPCIIGEPITLNYGCNEMDLNKPLVGVLGAFQAMEALHPNIGKWRNFTNTIINQYTINQKCSKTSHYLDDSRKVSGITAEDFLKNQSSYKLIDIRVNASTEFKGISNMPFIELLKQKELFLQEKNLLLLCKRGITAKRIAELIATILHKDCFYLIGGIDNLIELKNKGIPIELARK